MAERAFEEAERRPVDTEALQLLVDTLALGGLGAVAATDTGRLIARSEAVATLLPTHAALRTLLQQLVRALAQRSWQGTSDTFVWRHTDSVPLRVLFFPLRCNGDNLVLAIVEPLQRTDSVRRADFIARYGITVAEARVLERLVAGQRPAEIAAATGVALATVKTQLRSLFARTETRGQAELVALYLRSG